MNKIISSSLERLIADTSSSEKQTARKLMNSHGLESCLRRFSRSECMKSVLSNKKNSDILVGEIRTWFIDSGNKTLKKNSKCKQDGDKCILKLLKDIII